MQIKWTKKSLQNLEMAVDYISSGSPENATKVALHILESIKILSEQPRSGRIGRIDGTRELMISKYPYIVPYIIKDGVVIILRIAHTSMKWPEKF